MSKNFTNTGYLQVFKRKHLPTNPFQMTARQVRLLLSARNAVESKFSINVAANDFGCEVTKTGLTGAVQHGIVRGRSLLGVQRCE